MRYCLLEEDYEEFKDEYSKLEARYDTTEASWMGEDCDIEEGIKAPLKTNSFLVRFLNRKNLDMNNKKQIQTDFQVTVPTAPCDQDGDIKPENPDEAPVCVIDVTSQGDKGKPKEYPVFVLSGKFGSGMILGAERLQVSGNGFEVDRVVMVVTKSVGMVYK